MKEILKEFIQSKLDSGEASLGWFGDIKEFKIERYFMNSINGEETPEMVIVTSHVEKKEGMEEFNWEKQVKRWFIDKQEVNDFISLRRENVINKLFETD